MTELQKYATINSKRYEYQKLIKVGEFIMRKKSLILLVAFILCTVCTMFIGCGSSSKALQYNGVNLIDDATVTASDNEKNVTKLTDNSDSSWTTKKQGSYIHIDFGKQQTFNTIVLCESTDNVKNFEIQIYDENIDDYKMIYTQDRIDKYRMCAFENITAQKIKIIFKQFDKKVSISNIEVFNYSNGRQNFIRQAYMTSAIEGDSGLTTVQTRKDDPDFKNSLNVLTDVIIIGSVKLTTTATLECNSGLDNLKEDIRIIKELTNNKVKVHITIMTGIYSEFHANNKAMVKLAKNQLNDFKNNLREFVNDVNPDGIDYDWEYPQLAWQWQAYNDILIATKSVINGRQLSIALWPYGVNLSKEARACIDTVNIMAYDQFDKRGDHSSIYDCGLDVIEYFIGLGFSKNQLLLGIPFYGRTVDKAPQWPLYNESYGKWSNYTESYDYTDDKGTHNSAIYLNGYAMVRDKTALAIACDLEGIMIFSFNCDTPYSYEYSLHKAVESVIEQRLVTME